MTKNIDTTALAAVIATALAAYLDDSVTEAPAKARKATKATKAKATKAPVVTGGPSFPEARAALVLLKAEGKAPKGMTVREAIEADLLPALGTVAKAAPAKGKKAKAGKAKKAEPTGPAFGDLRAKLVAHKAAGLIVAGVSVRQAQALGLMDDEGNFTGDSAPAPKAAKASKKGKKARKAEKVAVVVEADEPAKVKAHEAPRRANGTIAPKDQWAKREELALTGLFDRFQIDLAVEGVTMERKA